MRYVFAGDRDISVHVLEFLIERRYFPSALIVSEDSKATHAQDLIRISKMPKELIFKGQSFNESKNLNILKQISPHYIFGIHFPYLAKREVLDIPEIGFLNLHPAFLPYNRGWHTPSWAILEKTKIGATLHFMSEQLDCGDIVHQKELEVFPSDTANTLYARIKSLELDVFKEALEDLITLNPPRIAQDIYSGTSHKRQDLFDPAIQKINLQSFYKAEDLINILRALTTNNIKEAAYFVKDGVKYHIQVKINRANDKKKVFL